MSSIKCPQCNLTNWSTALTCKRCEHSFQPAQESIGFIAPPDSPNEPAFVNRNPPPFQSQSYQTYDSSQQNSYQENQPYQNYQQPNYTYYKAANLKSGLAIASMVVGILSFLTGIFFIGILFAPIGLILGIVALVKANKKPQIYGGKAFAIVGIVMSSLIVVFIPVIAAIAIPNLLAARRAANEGSAISSLRTIAAAEQTYQSTTGQGKCGDLTELSRANLIPPQMTTIERNGYKYSLVKIPSINGGCEITATPAVSKGISATGTRSFYFSTDENVIRAAAKNGLLADRNDLPLGDNSYETNYPNSPNRPPQISSRNPNGF